MSSTIAPSRMKSVSRKAAPTSCWAAGSTKFGFHSADNFSLWDDSWNQITDQQVWEGPSDGAEKLPGVEHRCSRTPWPRRPNYLLYQQLSNPCRWWTHGAPEYAEQTIIPDYFVIAVTEPSINNDTCINNKFAKLGDTIAISKSETMNHWSTDRGRC